MGLDAKGRNFSAPRLTPGKSSESLVYGSPNMLKDQARQISIMEARAKRYGFGGIKSINSSTLGTSSSISTGLSSVPFGASPSASSYTAKPITIASNPNNRSTMANSARGYASAQGGANKNGGGVIGVIAVLLFLFWPVIISIIMAIISAIIELLS
jgi:hypothetical protein